jgi:hypothetical protein
LATLSNQIDSASLELKSLNKKLVAIKDNLPPDADSSVLDSAIQNSRQLSSQLV